MSRTVITFGTFDVFHVGHLRVIERAAALGDRLVVGVSADALNLRKKGREPVFSQAERLAIVAALKPVDEVFVEESLELKRDYIEQFAADVLVMGDDWAGRFDEFERHLRGRLPDPHPGHLDHRADREDLRPPADPEAHPRSEVPSSMRAVCAVARWLPAWLVRRRRRGSRPSSATVPRRRPAPPCPTSPGAARSTPSLADGARRRLARPSSRPARSDRPLRALDARRAPGRRAPGRPDATLALRDLLRRSADLDGDDRRGPRACWPGRPTAPATPTATATPPTPRSKKCSEQRLPALGADHRRRPAGHGWVTKTLRR